MDRAVEIAKASAFILKRPVQLSKEEIVKDGHYKTPVIKDPFTVSLDEKISLLLQADSEMEKTGKKIKSRRGHLRFGKMQKVFASSEGAYTVQEIIQSGGGIIARAYEDKEVQARSYPKRDGNFATMGYEFIEGMDLVRHAQNVADEALQLLQADDCPEKESSLILYPSQLYLQIHESIGHPIEADRILGSEITYAGGSFISEILNQLGSYRYASDEVSVVADATFKGALGTFGYDDEGVAAQRIDIIKNGILMNLLTSRETVNGINRILGKKIFQGSNGVSRASGWNRIPLIRMSNVSLIPGTWDLNNLIADTDDGIILDTNLSWSIDDLRKNFSFGTEIGWEIKKGKVVKPLKNPMYIGTTPVFWQSCDAICNEKYFEWYGTPTCGKGQPGQAMNVGHGASPARFRKVNVRSRRN